MAELDEIVKRLTNEELAQVLDFEVEFLVNNSPHEAAHIAGYREIARRLRNG